MATNVKVDAFKVVAALKAQSLRYRKTARLEVGYGSPTVPYAGYVHEDLQANHPRGGQAKFLEQPARQYAPQMGKIVMQTLRAKKSLESGLQEAGDYLLSKSLPLVPVDTGALKASGYARVV